ncbi:MAG: hypothetical protein IKY62_01165, partial [Clostridia bacterium]|nr:hypothetical protein [Clostridia bacterium]
KSLEDLRRRPINKPELYKKFTELELNSFISKFSLNPESSDLQSPTEEEKEAFEVLNSDEILDTGADLIAIFEGSDALYISDGKRNIKYLGDIAKIGAFFDNKKIVCYDGKRLYHSFMSRGVSLKRAVLLDLMVYSYVINPSNAKSTLPSLAAIYSSKSITDKSPCPCLMLEIEKAMRKRIEEDGAV